MPRRHFALPVACLCSTTFVLLALAGAARAQDRPRTLPTDGEQAFMREYQKQRQRFKIISSSSSESSEKANKGSAEDQKAIDVVAQYHTYRLTWDESDVAGGVNKLWDEFVSQVNNADSAAMHKNNPAFGEMYLKALTQRARDVMLTRKPIAAVNAARMLARLAKAGSEEAGDACLEAVKDNNNLLDPKARLGVQYWALQGLGNLLGRWADAPADAAPPAARAAREADYLKGLVQTIERKPADGPVPPAPDEVAGMQVFRREAVRALSLYRAPAVADAKGNVQVPTALALLKVVNDDGLSPKARLDEQIEAAVGVGRVQSKALASYQPDYAAQQLGYLVVGMARQAKPKDPNKFAWKVHAARLADAVEAMRAGVKGSPDKAGADYVTKLAGLVLRVLKDIETTEKANGDNASALNFWLGSTAVPHNTLYKGLADSTVRPLEKGDAPEKPADKPTKPGTKPTKPGDKPAKPDDKPAKPDDKPKKP
jgi:hypothetical protein